MKLSHRRQFLHLAAGAAVLPALSRVAKAEAYPTRPVRIIVGYPAHDKNAPPTRYQIADNFDILPRSSGELPGHSDGKPSATRSLVHKWGGCGP